MDEVIKDPRFSHIVKDSRFRRVPKKHGKVNVDKRFQCMFTEKKFRTKCRIDKRGRPINSGTSEDLKQYYEVSDSDSDSEDESGKESGKEEDEDTCEEDEGVEDDELQENEIDVVSSLKKKDESVKKRTLKDVKKSDEKIEISVVSKDNQIEAPHKSEKKLLTKEIKKKLRNKKIDYARGEGKLISDSSSEESSEEEVSDHEEHDWGELDNDAETTEEATNRLAICHMDWDRIKASDLMVLFHSFLPAGGLIHSITIYPSEFGTQRMKEEEANGPCELKELVTENEGEEMDREQMEKLRKYQLNRLKYYYGVMVCDTKETANALYKECDGLEYETSAVKLDLRFIPDDTTFDQEPKDTCTALPDLETYKPTLFQTTALTRSKVELTWDENDPDRVELVKAVHSGNADEEQLKQYLAYSSSDENDENEDISALINDDGDSKPETEQSSLEKYKSLLADIESNEKKKKKNDVNLEVTWNLKLENKANEIVKEKLKEKDNLTPFEQYMDKKKEKKKKKRLERKAKIEEEQKNSSDESAFSDDDIPSDVDMNDPYFREEFENKKPKKKKKNKKKVDEQEEESEETTRQKAELELLMLDENPQEKHFSLKNIEERENASNKKKSRKLKKRKLEVPEEDDFKIDVNDERFSALYSSHHFNIDPTDPQYKATKATRELIDEKLRRREQEERGGKWRKVAENGKQKNAELNVLVRTIKKNTAGIRKVN